MNSLKGSKVDKLAMLVEIQLITESIDQLAGKDSLATVDHKIKQRQVLLESLFDQHTAELTPDDLDQLISVQKSSASLLSKMESAKIHRGNEIIHNKSKGKRIRLYTTIAKQK
jgi:hypothetical protein